MADEEQENIPELVRRCFQQYQEATAHLRTEEIDNLGFVSGDPELQWAPEEVNARKGENQPLVTIDRCSPAVDQVTNEASNNPPGPMAEPDGTGADSESADIVESMVREYEYRSDAKTAYVKALEYAAKCGRGLFEMQTEYAGPRTMEQQIKVITCPDPAHYFYDPTALMPNKEDSMFGGRIRRLTRDEIINEFGKNLKILESPGMFGWMKEAMGLGSNVDEWCGGPQWKGPYYVCEFYRVVLGRKKSTMYSDGVMRYDDDKIPDGVEPKENEDGVIARWEETRTIKKYIVTALDLIKTTDWYGTIIPHFWVMGPETWRDGKLYRKCLFTGAKGSQRVLNYSVTSAAQITGSITKSPWVGYEGSFDVQDAQGHKPWDYSNSKMWSYLELKPVFAPDENGAQHLLPPPMRNTWEAPIQRVLELATFAIEQIKGATSVFFEPALPSAKDAQSGAAIKALQAQSNIGTGNWQKALHRAVMLSYQEAEVIFRQIYDGPRVRAIVRPDGTREIAEINKEFPADEMDHATGKHKKADGTLESTYNIARSQHFMRVTAGASFEDRRDKSVSMLTDLVKVVPQLFTNPQIVASFVRLVAQGDPQVMAIADTLDPKPQGELSPQQMQGQLKQLQVVNQQKDQIIGKLQQAIQAKLPELEQRKWSDALKALTQLRVAQINAGVDTAQTDASILEHITGLMNDNAQQAAQQNHEKQMATQQQIAASQQQTSQQQADAAQQQVDGSSQSE